MTISKIALFAFLFMSASVVSAATHIIKFGGPLGKKYSPASLTVSVGDTLVWVGDFDEHSLSLMKAPQGAKGFKGIESGSTFRYVVTVAGRYDYQCDDHVDMGMIGSFTAVAAPAPAGQKWLFLYDFQSLHNLNGGLMKRFYSFFLASVLLISGSARATTHIVTAVFDQSIGNFVYSPSQAFAVNVGDTIDWQMPFSTHTLGVTLNGVRVVDDGASNNTPPGGNDEKYVVPSVGTYTFLCTVHSTMHSSFTASAAGVEIPQETKMMMDPIYPNPAMDEAMVHFTLDNPAHVTLKIYNSTGTLVQTPTNEDMGTGFHMLMIDTKQFASGSYQYVLQAGDAVLRRAMIVAK
jgi:plastocyanin